MKVPKDHWLRNKAIAHRGIQNKREKIVENTLEAVILAVQKGFPVEIDIRLTNEGEIILLHDLTLKRVAGVKRHFTKLTKKELMEIEFKDSVCRIATLKQVLEVVNGQVPILLDLKLDVKFWRIGKLVKKLKELLNDYKGEIAIQSFHPRVSKICKKHITNTFVGLVASPVPAKSFLNDLFIRFSMFRYEYDFITYHIDNKINKRVRKKLNSMDKPTLSYYITNEHMEKRAKEENSNIIWADYEELDYVPIEK